MRVLFAVHGYPPECTGGTELFVRKLAGTLAGRGHNISVVCGSLQWFHQDRVTEDVIDQIPVWRIHRSDPFHERWEKSWCPPAGALFERALDTLKPDVVHVHHWMRFTRDIAELARRRGIPSVVTLHDLWSTCLKSDRMLEGEEFCNRPLEAAACAACVGGARPWTGPGEMREAARLFREDMIHELSVARRRIVPSKSHGARVAAALGMDPKLFTVVPNGSITELEPGKKRRPMADGMLRIGHWGALYPLKGVHVLLEAVHQCRYRDQMDIHLYGGASDEAYGAQLQQLADGLRVEFHGPFRAQDLARDVFDVVVMPSLAAESYSFALDEAMALGYPIVASDFGALGERVGTAGRLFPRGDRAALAAILDDFIERPASLSKFKLNNPPITVQEHAARLEKIYEESVKAQKAQPASAFDERAHAIFEFQRSENRLRHALRYESLARFAREVQEDRENRIRMIEFLQAERERLEKLNVELARRAAEAELRVATNPARNGEKAPPAEV
jgi:glycosyltransferase involved in cell wall biosynthesis